MHHLWVRDFMLLCFIFCNIYISEQKIIPGMTLACITIYCFIGLLAFNDLYMTYQS